MTKGKIRLHASMKTTFFIAGLSILLSACGTSDKDKQTKDTLLVKGAKATSVQIEPSSDFSFIAKPYRSTDLSFRISGPLEDLDIHSGRFYRKGEVIAQIDPRDFRIQQERTEAIYKQAKAEFDRIEVLYQKENLSASVYEKARAEYISAKTAFQTASNQLDDTKLIAPFDGYVGEVYVENFQDVKASQPILSFDDLGRLKIEVYVPQSIARKAGDMKDVRIVFDDNIDLEYTAQVEQVSKSTTRNNLSYLITAILPNGNNRLLAGMSGKVIFPPAEATEKRIALPCTAICHTPTEGAFVWIINKETNQVSKRKIKIGQLLSEGAVHIVSGVEEGEMVSISKTRFLSEGCPVELINN